MKSSFIFLMLILSVAGCQSMETARESPDGTGSLSSSHRPSPVSSDAATTKRSEAASVSFIDSSVFDSDLHDALFREPATVYVTPVVPFDLNRIPPRLDKWLAAVKSGGGKVVARQDTTVATRGLLAMVIDVVVALYEQVAEQLLYAPAKQYDATLYYGADGKVERVVFTRR